MKEQCARYDDEHNKLLKIINFRFPHSYKKVGLIGAGLVFVFLLGYQFFGEGTLLVKDACRTLILLFLLVASLSKDVIEDEYIQHLRAQSYVAAFVCATAYYISIPLISLVMDILITSITGDGTVNFLEGSAFEVLFMLICFQLLFFRNLKKVSRAQ